ncbi:unnamed protein product, partial [Pleuronectes platessa]
TEGQMLLALRAYCFMAFCGNVVVPTTALIRSQSHAWVRERSETGGVRRNTGGIASPQEFNQKEEICQRVHTPYTDTERRTQTDTNAQDMNISRSVCSDSWGLKCSQKKQSERSSLSRCPLG